MDIFGASGILAIGIPILVNLIKKIPAIGSKYAPVVAFVLGVIGGVVAQVTGFTPEGMTMVQAIMAGIAVGGTSTGLYDLFKKLTNN